MLGKLSAALLVAISSSVAAGPAHAANPFAAFAGRWRGGGTVRTDAGQEALRCKARYKPAGGHTLSLDVDCASDSYRVNIVSTVRDRGNRFSGSWQETTRQVSGDVSGSIPEPDTFQASLETLGGGIEIGARSNGKVQAISITSQGTAIQSASIVLKRR